MLTQLQRQILEYAKEESFHATLNDFINRYGVSSSDAIAALKDLKRKRIVTMPPNIMNTWIGVTNYGWGVMGWH